MNFSEKIQFQRKRNGITQEELSEKMEVSRQTISKWEAGLSFPEVKKIVVMITLIFSIVGCNKMDVSQLEMKGELVYKIGNKKPFTGKVIKTYPNGLYRELNYKDGKLEGIFKSYNKNGNIYSEENYKNGKLEGLSKSYYENGNIDSELNYKDDKLEGSFRSYYENGNIYSEGNYKNGKLEGLFKRYYESGKIESIVYYREDGELDSYERYDENGQLIEEKIYPIIEF